MNNINSHKEEINKLINQGRLLDALKYVREHDTHKVCTPLLSDIDNTFIYMLQYFGRCTFGVSDPSRKDIVRQTREALLRAADALDIAQIKPTADGIFFSSMRTVTLRVENKIIPCIERVKKCVTNADLAEEAGNANPSIRKSLDDVSDTLFISTWTTPHLGKAEYDALQSFLTDFNSANARSAKALVLAALLLSSVKYYDYRKLQLLLKCTLADTDIMLKARALTGALLILSKYPSRIASDNSIRELTESLEDNAELLSAVSKFIPAMLRTIDTDRVNKRVKDEIIPELMRMKPDIERTMKRMGGSPDIYELEENPDWENILNKSGISDKLKELTELQMEGADIFMSAFAQMKGFPFFRSPAHWLLPFDINHSELEQTRAVIPSNLLALLDKGIYFCASDQYSMMLALSKMPTTQFNMMSSQLSEQMNSMREDAQTSLLGESKDLAAEISLYLKDLYRFFRLKNDDNDDPFGKIYEMPELAPFTSLHSNAQLQRSIAEFYFKYGYWQQAFDAFSIVQQLSDNALEDVLQKQGYCMQLSGNNKKALTLYKQAELLNPDSEWLLKRIASVLRDMNDYSQAAEYAQKALTLNPDNLNLEMLLGTTLMLDGKAREALKSFYKIKYLKPENTKVLRPIAWCEFMLGNYDKSIAQYEALPNTTYTDMLNCGHVFFAKGDIAGALLRYRSCLKTLENGTEEFRKLMHEDKHYLTAAGVDSMDVDLITDLALSTEL